MTSGPTSDKRIVNGIRVIRTRGTMAERARMHTRLLREEVRNGVLPVAAAKNERLIRKGPGLAQIPFVQDSAVWFYRNILIPLLDRNTDQETKDLIQAVAEESGLSPQTVRQGLFQPDGLMMLSRLSVMKHLVGELPAGGLPGCTSAVVTNKLTESGRMLVARNQDYPLVGPWEPNATLEFHEPTESGAIPLVSVATAGIMLGGLTAMNREGITLAAHAHFGRGISFRGTTVVTLGYEIIRKAKTIGQAVDLAKKHRRHANWAFVVASGKEDDAVVIEMTPDQTCVRHPSEGILAHSNYFQSKELRGVEALISGGCCDDFVARVQRVRQLLEPRRGTIQPQHMVQLLGDFHDPQTNTDRLLGGTISVVTTIKSVVFDPIAQTLWMAPRAETPVGFSTDFVEFDLPRFWSLPDGVPVKTIPGTRSSNPRFVTAMREFREAYRAFHMENDQPGYLARARAALNRSLALYSDDGNVWIQAGVLAFIDRDFGEGRRFFEGAASRVLPVHSQNVCQLFLARSHDLLGDRKKARAIYQKGSEEVLEPRLRDAFRKGIKTRYKAKHAAEIMADLQFPDPFQY